MESQPQNPEFRNNPENFHPWSVEKNTSEFDLGFLLLRYSVVYTVESLSLFYILFCMIHRYVRDSSCEPTIHVS